MNKDLIIKMQSQFDQLAQTHPEELHLEFFFGVRCFIVIFLPVPPYARI